MELFSAVSVIREQIWGGLYRAKMSNSIHQNPFFCLTWFKWVAYTNYISIEFFSGCFLGFLEGKKSKRPRKIKKF